MKEKIAAEEAAFPEDEIRQEAASAGSDSAARETVIPYTGDLEIQKIAAGQQDLFLMRKKCRSPHAGRQRRLRTVFR